MRPLTTAAFSFYVLRHGETDSNAANIIQGSSDNSRLTANGKSQAMAVGQMAFVPETTKRIDQIFLSPLTRAHETLSLIRENAPPNMLPDANNIIVLPNLREIDFYSWENETKEFLKTKHPKEYAAWKRGDPDGLVVDGRLPLHETWARAEEVWKEIREQATASSTTNGQEETAAKLIVCHGTLGQALLGTAFGKDATTFRQHVFPNCGIAEIVWHEGEDMAASWGWHNEVCQV